MLDPTLEVTVPENGHSGESVVFSVHIVNGKEPFTLSWDFDGGALPRSVDAHTVSRDSQQEVKLADVSAETTYTWVAHLTSAYGASAHASGSFTVLPALDPNHPPVITAASFNESLTAFAVQATDEDGDSLTVSVSGPEGVTISPPSQTADAGGLAIFDLVLPPGTGESPGSLHVLVEDGQGGEAVRDEVIPGGEVPPPPVLEADTLYAIPQTVTAVIGEPVTVLVATGVPASPFQFLNGVRVTVEEGADFVPESFNVGAVGGVTYEADGIWAVMAPSGGFLAPPTPVHPSPVALGGGLLGFDFGLTPLSGTNLTDTSGELFNFALSFAEPGTYHLSFQGNEGAAHTYYGFSDGGGVSTKGWGDISNVHGFAHTVVVTAP